MKLTACWIRNGGKVRRTAVPGESMPENTVAIEFTPRIRRLVPAPARGLTSANGRIFILLLTPGIRPDTQKMSGTSIQQSRLFQDLYHPQHDVMFRAMSFIALQGGPVVHGDDRPALEANREYAEQWLMSRQEHKILSKKYQDFVRTWSPVFVD